MGKDVEDTKQSSDSNNGDSQVADRSIAETASPSPLQDFASKEVWNKDSSGFRQMQSQGSAELAKQLPEVSNMLNNFQLSDNGKAAGAKGENGSLRSGAGGASALPKENGEDNEKKESGPKGETGAKGALGAGGENGGVRGLSNSEAKVAKLNDEQAKGNEQNLEKKEAGKGESVIDKGGSKITLDAKGEINKVETPNGVVVEKDGKGWKTNNEPVDNVSFDKQGNVQIDWAKTKDGVSETTTLRPSGLESSFNPPKQMGNQKIKSMEINPRKDGTWDTIARTEDNKVLKDQLDVNGQRTNKNEKIEALTKLPPEQLDKAAAEVARLIDKNGGKFGNAHDKNYFSEADKAFTRNKSLDFEDKVNDALKAQNSPYRVSNNGLRNSSNDDFSISVKGGRATDLLSLPKVR